MNDVSATVFLNDGGKIFIVSDSASYDSNNNDTLFKGSVKMNYNDHTIKSNYIDLSFEENKAIIYENINYNSNLSKLEADKIIVDFLEMKVKILMDDTNDKVLVKTILKNGNN
jgi:lipopolysaccharide assembly outer membrane protein LptD (OstA)